MLSSEVVVPRSVCRGEVCGHAGPGPSGPGSASDRDRLQNCVTLDLTVAVAPLVRSPAFTPAPDARYEIRSFAVDETRKNAIAHGVFRGTHTGPGGPVPPTGKAVEADYVYVMEFDADHIRHLTKIWNDVVSLKQLGWM